MRTIEIQLFTFDELAPAAKEKAREWYRGLIDASEYADSVYDDASQIAAILGIEFDRDKRGEPMILWSGFYSQGDGACFEGSYRYKAGCQKAIRGYAPKDEALHKIADNLAELQKRNGFKLRATVKHSGNYSHEYCTRIDVVKDSTRDGYESEDSPGIETEKALAEILRAFMRWIYRQLEAAHEAAHADENVDETIRANDYEFEASGKHAA